MRKYFADYILTSANASPSFPAFIKGGMLIADEKSGNILSVQSAQGGNKNAENAKTNWKTGGKEYKTVIIPGFINAHMHTDITFKPDSDTPRIFSKWVLSVIEKRKILTQEEKTGLRIKAFKESVESGTTVAGDIICLDSFYDMGEIRFRRALAPRVKGFIELRGIDPSAAGKKIDEFKIFFENRASIFGETEKYFSTGISPHSIYSVSGNLFKEIRKISRKLGFKTVIHASEHFAETQYISGKGGDIAENLLPALGFSGFSKPEIYFPSPVFYLNYLKMLNKNVSLIHANEISVEEIDIIKESGADIIHCPRSNDFFSSKKLPLKKILEKGISVSLGTDGLYSNQSLSILDELKFARKIHPEVKPKDLFYSATQGGARTLSFKGVSGVLKPGSYADFIIFKAGKNALLNEDNIYDEVLSFDKPDILSVVIGGETVYAQNCR